VLVRAAWSLVIVVIITGCAAQPMPQPSATEQQSPTEQPSAAEQPALHVIDVDGPGVTVMLGGQSLASVPCGGSAEVTPGGTVPPLPWELTILADDGGALQFPTREVDTLPWAILIRGRVALSGSWPMSYGPAPANLNDPCASVPPS
jgi:hypothetical protein